MGPIYKINSNDVFVRSGGKSQISVVKLRKDVSSKEVERMDWEVVECVGTNLTCHTLEIFGKKLHGEDVEKLAMNLCETRLWVNNAGRCFARLLEITNLSYRETNKVFDWDKYGVKSSERVAKEKQQAESERVAKEKQAESERVAKEKQVESEIVAKEKQAESERVAARGKEAIRVAKEKEIKDEQVRKPKKNAEVWQNKSKSSWSSSSSSSSTYMNMSQNDQQLYVEKWRIQVSPQQFEMQWAEQNYVIDLKNNRLKLKPTDANNLAEQNQHPYGVKVCVSDGKKNFDKNYWSFIKVENESSREESLLAFYEGSFDTFVTRNNDYVGLPHHSLATCSSNFPIALVNLRGYGVVYGFCYSRNDGKSVGMATMNDEMYVTRKLDEIQSDNEDEELDCYILSDEEELDNDGPKMNCYLSDGNDDQEIAYVDMSPDEQRSYIQRWQHKVFPQRFEMQRFRQDYAVDLRNRLKLVPTDVHNLAERNEYPCSVEVYVSDGQFDTNDWSYIKIENESSGDESLFAFYEGGFDTVQNRNDWVCIPHHRRAKCSSSFPITLVDLRGYGVVYGFCYTSTGEGNSVGVADEFIDEEEDQPSFTPNWNYDDQPRFGRRNFR